MAISLSFFAMAGIMIADSRVVDMVDFVVLTGVEKEGQRQFEGPTRLMMEVEGAVEKMIMLPMMNSE